MKNVADDVDGQNLPGLQDKDLGAAGLISPRLLSLLVVSRLGPVFDSD